MTTQPMDETQATSPPAGGVGGPPVSYTKAIIQAEGPNDYVDIILLADALDDIEKVRISNENRLRSLTSTEDWGKGVPAERVEFFATTVDTLRTVESGLILELKRAVRRSPLGPFQQATRGLGEKSLGRLIKEIGDPAWNDLHNRPRRLRELYAYCGYHVISKDSGQSHSHDLIGSQSVYGVAPTRTKGTKANWSTNARSRCYVIAESMVRVPGATYRPVYDQARTKYADATHPTECRRCGPAGHPAPEGSPLSLGHQQGRAMRIVSKAFLADLWRAAHPQPEQPHA